MRRWFLTCCLLLLTLPSSRAVDPVALLRQMPGQPNAVAVINTDLILKTPRATKDGWTKLEQTGFIAGVVPIHPGIERLVAVTEFKPSKQTPPMSAALIATNRKVNLPKISEQLKATPATIANLPAATTTTGSTLVTLEDQLLGILHSGSKEVVSTWIEGRKKAGAEPADKYLTSTLNAIGTRHHMLIAVDVAGMYDAPAIDGMLALSPLLDQDKKASDQVKRFLVGMKGIVFQVNLIEDGIQLRLVLDSVNQPTAPAELMKEFVIESIGRLGADFVDLRASVAKNGNSDFTLTFKITDDELGHLMTLVLPPVMAEVAASETLPVAPAGVQRANTIKYLVAANATIDELKRKYPQATDYGRTAMWHETSAQKIEALSVVGVDPKVVEYGLGTAKLFREIGASLRGVPIQAAALEGNAYLYVQRQPAVLWTPFHGLNFNPWYGTPGNVNTNIPQVRQQQAEVIRKDQENRMAIWQAIESKRSEMVREVGSK